MLHSSFTGCSSLVLMWNGGFCIVGWFNFFCMATLVISAWQLEVVFILLLQGCVLSYLASTITVGSNKEAKRPSRVVDVGCGVGGSSRYLAKKYGAHVEGITLSERQVQRAIELTAAEGLSDKVAFQLADALDQPFPDGHFDLVWAMESGEHMPDKKKFMQELVRVAAPGASIIIVTCCHRDLLTGETSLQPTEQELLDKISRACCLPAWCSTVDYVKMAQALSLQNIRTADWSENVAPFWSSIIKELGKSFREAGSKVTKGASPIPLWVDAFKQELVKYAVITAQKPA